MRARSFKPRRPARRAKKVVALRRRGRVLAFRTAKPIFTETFVKPVIAPNTGAVMTFNINEIPQLAQYNTLYQKYRILKASVLLVPQYVGSEQNAAEYNAGNSVYAHGQGRMVWAVNDSPGVTAPASELDVLKDNGCKVRPVKSMLRMGCRPVPLYEDNNGILITLKKNWINFQTGPSAPADPKHFGLSYWYSQPSLGTTAQTNNDLIPYVKLTFQLADPR